MRMTKKRWAATLVTTAALLFGAVGGTVLWHSIPHHSNLPPTADQLLPPEQTPAGAKTLYPMAQAGETATPVWGYLTADGQWKIPPQYTQALPFYQGATAAWVQQDGVWSALDADGQRLAVGQGGTLAANSHDGFFVFYDNGVSSLYNNNGVKIFGVEGRIGSFYGEFAPFTRQKDGTEYYGLVDRKGNIAIAPLYTAISLLDDTTPIAKTIEGQVVVLNLAGEVLTVLPPAASISNAGEGVTVYRDEQGFFGYLDKNGIKQIEAQYYLAEPFQNGAALVKTKQGYRLIDKNGAYLTDSYENGVCLGQGLFALTPTLAQPYTIFNAAGQPVSAGDVCQWNHWENGAIGIQTTETSYLMDKTGHILPGSTCNGSYQLSRQGSLFYGENVSRFYYDDTGAIIARQTPSQQLANTDWQVTPQLFAPSWYVQMTYPVFQQKGVANEGLNAMVQEWAVEDFYEENEPDEANRYAATIRGSYQLTTVGTLANLLYTTERTDHHQQTTQQIRSTCLVDLATAQRYRLEDLFFRGWKEMLRQEVAQRYQATLVPGAELPPALAKQFANPNWPQRNEAFTLTAEGVTLYLTAETTPIPVTVPYAALQTKINEKSSLWQLLQTGSDSPSSRQDTSK